MQKGELVIAGVLTALIFLFPVAAFARSGALDVHSAILIDTTDGRVLYEQNADSPIPPASVTKILSLYIVFEKIREGELHAWEKVHISKKAACTGGSRMCVRSGKEVPLEELIKGMAVASGNDACVAVAEHVSGSVEEFVKLMNRKAKELGMENSVFNTPNGLPSPGQFTTARDLSKLSMAYLRRFPDALAIHSMRTYTYDRATHRNANRLLGKCLGVDGIKTGFVCAAGYNISATAKRGDVRLLAVVLGARTPGIRVRETATLLEAGFRKVAQGSSHSIASEDLKATGSTRLANAPANLEEEQASTSVEKHGSKIVKRINPGTIAGAHKKSAGKTTLNRKSGKRTLVSSHHSTAGIRVAKHSGTTKASGSVKHASLRSLQGEGMKPIKVSKSKSAQKVEQIGSKTKSSKENTTRAGTSKSVKMKTKHEVAQTNTGKGDNQSASVRTSKTHSNQTSKSTKTQSKVRRDS